MAINKRKLGSTGLQRRVRPRREDDWEMDHDAGQASSSEDDGVEEQSTRRNRDDDDSEEDEDEEEGSEDGSGSGEDSEDDDDDEPAAPKVDLSSISFGALAKAQASLPPSKRKSKATTTTTNEEEDNKPLPRKPSTRKDDPKPKPKRSSKHAPQEQTSKRPVSRRRDLPADDTHPRRTARDPRFDPLVGRLDEEKAQRNYAFLDEYRDREMAELAAQIKKTRDPNAKERLKRELLSMESKKKARVRRDEEQRLLTEHRRREKGLVAQGKTPFYLKRSEQKKKLLTERYESMSKGQVDRAIERKRKKVLGKEKKELDYLARRSRS